MADPTNRKIVTVNLDEPIRRGDQVIDKVQIRKPGAGECRGLSLVALGQLDVDELRKILPRITIPTLTQADVDAMDLGDLLNMGSEIGRFLLTRERLADFPTS